MSLDSTVKRSLRLPAVCAPMSVISGPDLVREACKAGIMGVLPRHNAPTIEVFEQWLTEIRRDLDDHQQRHPDAVVGPLAVNFAGRAPIDEIRSDLELAARSGVKVVINALGDPTELTKVVHDWGGLVYHDATSLRFAEKAITAGVDGVTCIIGGGGGHSGTLSPFVFVQQVRQSFDGTILLAGTISDGTAIRAAEVLGADLAYLGTRFIASREANVPEEYRRMLIDAKPTDLIYTPAITAVPANWLRPSLESVGLDPDNLPMSAGRGTYDHLPEGTRPWHHIWSAGQGVGLINDAPSVADIVEHLEAEYRLACEVACFAGAEALQS